MDQRKSKYNAATNILFGSEQDRGPRRKRQLDQTRTKIHTQQSLAKSVHEFFFGFLYEDEPEVPTDEEHADENVRPAIYGPLCIHLFLQSAASGAAISQGHMTAAILGTAIGKFVTGLLPDILGARYMSIVFALLLSGVFVCMSLFAGSPPAVLFFLVEFCYSIQWPCAVLVLHAHRQLDQGVFWISLACRLGSIAGVGLLRRQWLLVAWLSAIAASVVYHRVHDTPDATHQPQQQQQQQQRPSGATSCITRILHHGTPAVRRIVTSPQFWMLSTAHTGASLIRTADRVVAPTWHGVGTLVGLVLAGPLWTHQRNHRARKWMVSRLYGATVVACYGIAATLVLGSGSTAGDEEEDNDDDNNNELAQLVCSMCVGVASFAMAVPFYHIPSLVVTNSNNNHQQTGLFLAYTDGIAYAAASAVWCAGHRAWTWALVALWVLVAGVVMVELLEHYLCRPHRGDYETILLA